MSKEMKNNREAIKSLYEDDVFLSRVYAYVIEDGTFPRTISVWTDSGLAQTFLDIEGITRCFVDEDNLKIAEYELSVSPLYDYLQVKNNVKDKLDFYFAELYKEKETKRGEDE